MNIQKFFEIEVTSNTSRFFTCASLSPRKLTLFNQLRGSETFKTEERWEEYEMAVGKGKSLRQGSEWYVQNFPDGIVQFSSSFEPGFFLSSG